MSQQKSIEVFSQESRYLEGAMVLKQQALKIAADIVTAYVSNNKLNSEDLPKVLRSVYTTLDELSGMIPDGAKRKPAVPVEQSIQDDYITCLEDGAKLKTLKRYLRNRYGLTPLEYRRRWGLDNDYPMVSPSYTRRRSEVARMIGLGKTRGRSQSKNLK